MEDDPPPELQTFLLGVATKLKACLTTEQWEALIGVLAPKPVLYDIPALETLGNGLLADTSKFLNQSESRELETAVKRAIKFRVSLNTARKRASGAAAAPAASAASSAPQKRQRFISPEMTPLEKLWNKYAPKSAINGSKRLYCSWLTPWIAALLEHKNTDASMESVKRVKREVFAGENGGESDGALGPREVFSRDWKKFRELCEAHDLSVAVSETGDLTFAPIGS